MKRVFDEPNPFGPEIRKERLILGKKKDDPSTSKEKPYQRIKTRLQEMNAYNRHKEFINNYVLYYSGSTKKLKRDTSNDKGIYDDNHRFLWDDESTLSEAQTWESKLAKKYYDKLFKEYCIADLSHYEKNKIAMRWRVKSEVFSGKGQFECGNKHCNVRENLSSWEVNFAYIEDNVRKNALVKLRLCVDCSAKLNYRSKKRLIKKEIKEHKKEIENKNKRVKLEKKEKNYTLNTSTELSKSETKPNLKIKQELEETDDNNEQEKKEQELNASKIWTDKSAILEAERTIEDEFDEFIDDLLF